MSVGVRRLTLLALASIVTAAPVPSTPTPTPTPTTATLPPAPTAAVTAPPTSPTTTALPSTTIDPNAPRSLSVLLTGDILTENAVLVAGAAAGVAAGTRYDFSSLFAPITPLVQSFDLAICQMEIPIGRPEEEPGAKGRSPYGGNLLLAPYELAGDLAAAGFDRCTTASNHSYDLGDAGIDSTIDALRAVGVSWSGTAQVEGELPSPVFEARGIAVAHLSYARRLNTDQPADEWRLAYAEDPAEVAADVAAVRAAGAELVIVSLHVFKEMTEQPIELNTSFAAALTATADIDALIHHGPHVVQPFEVINGTPVWWSIGNLLSGMASPGAGGRYADPRSRDGLGAVLNFVESGPRSGEWQLTTSSVVLCNEASSRVIYPSSAVADPALPQAVRDQLAGCVERTRRAVPDAA